MGNIPLEHGLIVATILFALGFSVWLFDAIYFFC